MIDLISEMLKNAGGDDSVLPATELYREGWMLRLVLNWFSTHSEVKDHRLSFHEGAKWFSEAHLPSPFRADGRKDPLSESRTHADGVVGHFMIGGEGKCDLALLNNATQFVVVEAKMSSKLTPGVSHAKYYNQAARNVACIAELIQRQDLDANAFEKLAFFVIAPDAQLKKHKSFKARTNRDDIYKIVEKRVSEYKDSNTFSEKKEWLTNSFQPMLKSIDIDTLSWEGLIKDISRFDRDYSEKLNKFYQKCLQYNC